MLGRFGYWDGRAVGTVGTLERWGCVACGAVVACGYWDTRAVGTVGLSVHWDCCNGASVTTTRLLERCSCRDIVAVGAVRLLIHDEGGGLLRHRIFTDGDAVRIVGLLVRWGCWAGGAVGTVRLLDR